MTLKNRIIMSAMDLGFTSDGAINDRIINFYIERAKGELPAQYTNTFDHLLSRREEFVKKLKDLESEEIVPVNKDAKVVVNKVVHPGVEITIGDSTMSILEEYRGTTFYLSGDEIKTKK